MMVNHHPEVVILPLQGTNGPQLQSLDSTVFTVLLTLSSQRCYPGPFPLHLILANC